ncbi:serine protease inhibitor 42Dd-like [Cochliomyia hominivorax]
MWRIYVILTLWTQTLNAQYNIYMTNSGDTEDVSNSGKNTFNALNSRYTEHDYNRESKLNSSRSSTHKYNTNSRNSFKNQNNTLVNIREASFISPQLIENTPIVNSLSTKFPTFDNILKPTPASTAFKISTGNNFNAKLFEIMSSNSQHENLVYSPFSLETLLAFISTMSDGRLYEELLLLLGIPDNRTYVAQTFENILKLNLFNTPPPTTLTMANKLYYDYRFGPIDHSVQNYAKNSFSSEMEQIDFLVSKKAADVINSWVSEKTHNRIQNIVTPSSITSDTSALLLNSIYFKGEWLTKFASYDTETQDFFVTRQRSVPVDMMNNEDVFRYADFPDDLQASVVEMPYKNSNLSMLLILPKDTEGLANLEKSLRSFNFKKIAEKLKRELVTIKLPKFQIEFEIDMIKPLQELGLNALFNNVGNINLFKNQQKPLKVDQLKHKSFINVNEAGTEAAAATVGKYIPLSIPVNMKYFIANHPFVFVIRDSDITYFIGHVAKL